MVLRINPNNHPPSTSLGDSNPRPSSDTRSQDQALTTAPKAIADGEGATLFLNHYAARAPNRVTVSPRIRLRSCTHTPISEVPRVGRLVSRAKDGAENKSQQFRWWWHLEPATKSGGRRWTTTTVDGTSGGRRSGSRQVSENF
ncbi:hypothetical protein V6N13_034243 [Hibiscus sabdariffa]